MMLKHPIFPEQFRDVYQIVQGVSRKSSVEREPRPFHGTASIDEVPYSIFQWSSKEKPLSTHRILLNGRKTSLYRFLRQCSSNSGTAWKGLWAKRAAIAKKSS